MTSEPEPSRLEQLINNLGDTTQYMYVYTECKKLGHDWETEPWRWFRFGWRRPWRSRVWSTCKGCGISKLLPPELRRTRTKRFPGEKKP